MRLGPGSLPIRHHHAVCRLALRLLLALLLCGGLARTALSDVRAQTPAATPTPPGNGGTLFGTVRVTAGNDLQRNAGFENQPPVWLTIDTKGTSAVVTIGNATRVPLDLTGTVIINLESGVQSSTVLVSVGSAVIQGNQIVWSNFSLSSGQIAPAIISLVATGAPVTSTAPAIRDISIEAKNTQTGARVTEQVAGGGPARAALAAAVPSPAASGSAAATAAGSTTNSTGTVSPLSRDDARLFGAVALALLICLLLAMLVLAWLVSRLFRRPAVATAPAAQSPLDGALTTAVARLEAATRALESANATDTPIVTERLQAAVVTLQNAARWLQTAATGAPGTASVPTAQHPEAPNGPILLEQRGGTDAGKRWLLEDPEARIGRGRNNEIVVTDPRVSEIHARLVRQPDGRYLLIDNRSTNGTGVNGRLITEPVLLSNGDTVRVGGATLVVHDPAVGPEDDTVRYSNR